MPHHPAHKKLSAPKPPKVRTQGLSRVIRTGETVSATLLVGANKGKQPINSKGFCASQPEAFTQKEMDERVTGIRTFMLRSRGLTWAEARKALAASRVAQKGWYKGAPEQSASYTIFHDPSILGEETPEKFQSSMRTLAEAAAAGLCQDEIIVSFDAAGKKTAEGVVADAKERKSAAALFGKKRR